MELVEKDEEECQENIKKDEEEDQDGLKKEYIKTDNSVEVSSIFLTSLLTALVYYAMC